VQYTVSTQLLSIQRAARGVALRARGDLPSSQVSSSKADHGG